MLLFLMPTATDIAGREFAGFATVFVDDDSSSFRGRLAPRLCLTTVQTLRVGEANFATGWQPRSMNQAELHSAATFSRRGLSRVGLTSASSPEPRPLRA